MCFFNPRFLRATLLAIAIMTGALSAIASHIVGMDLYYTHVSGNTYRINLVAYGDCGSSGPGTAFSALPTASPRIYIFNGNTIIDSLNLTVQAPSTGVEITPVCPAYLSMTKCTSLSFTTPGIKKFVYSGTYTLPTTSSVWRFRFTGQLASSLAGRATTITNISFATGSSLIELVDTLNNTVAPNSNPVLTNVPTPFFCLSTANNYNPGAVDPNITDRLAFSLVGGKDGSSSAAAATNTVYITPYSGTNPLAVSSMSFDAATGQFAFVPNLLQRSLVVYNVREFRDGVFVGSCQREMTFLVQTCTNTPPNGFLSGATNGTIVDSTHFRICQNSGTFSMRINPFQAVTTNNIFVSASGLPAGLTFVTTGNGTPTPSCLISWTSTGVTPGDYTFYVTYTDNNCPLAGTQTIAYTITVLPQPVVNMTQVSTPDCYRRAGVSITPSGGGSPWRIKVSNASSPFDTIRTFTGVSATFIDSLTPGSYIGTVFSSTAAGCYDTAALTIPAPSFPPPTATMTNPSYCGANDGRIRLNGLTPGTIDTIRFTKDGIAQPAVIGTVAADGSFTISGLGAGTYASLVVTVGRYCRSTPVGPFVLTSPPFTIRTATSINPPYCGICTGSITLYGLRPGQTDTISYFKDGVPQTPIIRTIGADSTVVISGLCPGAYAGIVARTAGICVSNTIGPIILTAPPFTARAVIGSNPTNCGLCNGGLIIYGLYPGQTDTITYLRDGVAQPAVIRTIGPDSTVTITGLCAGTYSSIVIRTAGVCSTTVGPVTLVNPPFTMTHLSGTNPRYCGTCDGSITLHGLYPGQTDTITYRKDGVPQTPVVRVIPSTGTVTITGLCQGVYDSFVARTAGTCISNVLGPITLTVPPFTMRAITFTNPDYCGTCNGVIRLLGLFPGQRDTVSYEKDGVPQTFVQLVGADSTITISGLCPGVYTNFVARTGGICVSNTLGPVTLTVPPFTMRALTFTNPPYCGICTGTITLYGLYPGQRDTVSYTKDGVAQTPHIQVVGADSTITITGLCAGFYDNFVARTGGVCVSNTLGPADLTVPPFTIGGFTFTNPPYCGICTGTITLRGLYPGQVDSVYFTKDGVPQPVVVRTVAADSTIVLTGLCAGLYDNILVRAGGVCVSNVVGPANLTVPPFTMRDISSTDPTKCGFCDGRVKLFGLYPGQLDTIYYRRNGTAQTPIAATVAADSTITLTGLCAGVYSDFVARTGGVCVSNTLGPVTLTDPPIIPGYNFTVGENCKADTVRFINTSTPAADLTYRWFFGDGDSSTAINPTHIYTLPRNYDVTLYITNTRCVDSITKVVPITNIVKAGFIANPDSFTCTGKPVTLTNTSLGFNLNYAWYFGDGNTANTRDAVHTFERTGTYTIIMALSNDVPCRDTARVTIEVDSISTASVSASDTVLCGGRTVTFNGVFAQAGLVSYLWTFSDGSTIANVNPVRHAFDGAGNLSVRLDAFYRACPDTFATKSVWVFNNPQVQLGGDTTICPGGNPITIGDGRYSGMPMRWLWNTGARTPSIQIGNPGTYWVQLTVDGCIATDSVIVNENCFMDVPNAFSPNGDGVNEYFMPRPLAAAGLATFKMTIFNRWGQTIFETQQIEGRGWDGSFNGTPQPEGVYVYLIEATFTDGQIDKRQGNVTLLR